MIAGARKAKKILVVDDEPELVKALELRFSNEGFHVITAADGEEGLRKAKEEGPDLIILDIMLPKMDGYKVCNQLKSDARYQQIPIIMLTVKYQDKDKIEGFKTGADEYITKPFEFDELAKRVYNHLGMKKDLR